MKSLKPNSKALEFSNEELIEIQARFNISFPDYFVSFLKTFGGTSTKEMIFNDKFWVNFFLPLKSNLSSSIESTLQTYKEELNTNIWLPFAVDSGGWVFNIALNVEINGQIWIDKFDSGEEDTMEFVAPSFEKFIDGLQTEEEAGI